MDWLPLAALGIMWAAFLLPTRRRGSPAASVEDFERRMGLLANTDAGSRHGRWIVTPQKGVPFLGPRDRARARAKERRKRVFVLLLESIVLTFMIGIVPPLRVMWTASAVFTGLLLLYIAALLAIKNQAPQSRQRERAAAARAPSPGQVVRPATERYVADGASRVPRPAFNGLGALAEGELVHVVVHRREGLGTAGA